MIMRDLILIERLHGGVRKPFGRLSQERRFEVQGLGS